MNQATRSWSLRLSPRTSVLVTICLDVLHCPPSFPSQAAYYSCAYSDGGSSWCCAESNQGSSALLEFVDVHGGVFGLEPAEHHLLHGKCGRLRSHVLTNNAQYNASNLVSDMPSQSTLCQDRLQRKKNLQCPL
jgi:hypothetical protein